jgi:two-component system cell cycle sensor histidine kinase/response regulator CckA
MSDAPQRILDALDVGVVIHDADDRIVYANARASELLGITHDDFTSRTSYDVRWNIVSPDGRRVDPEDLPARRARMGTVVRGQVLGVRRPDSSERVWILCSALPEMDAEGGIARVVVTFSDFSVAQNAFREQEATYQSAFRSMSEGLVVFNADGSIRSANAAAERVLGLTVDQMESRHATDPRWRLINPDGLPAAHDEIPSEVVLRTGQPVADRVLGVHRPTGELAWLQVRADPLREPGDARVLGAIATFTDITREREISLALDASRAQVQRVLDAVPGMVFQYLRPVDSDGGFVFLGGRTQELIGLDHEQLQARPERVLEHMPAEVLARLRTRAVEAALNGGTFEQEVAFRRPDGDLRWLAVHCVSEQTADGRLTTGVVLDATESHRLADALRQRQQREAMGEMAAGIAHNFNNMLAVVIPNLELARATANEQTRALLGDAEQAAYRAADLVRRMMTLVRTNTPNAEGTTDLVPVVREALHICRETFDRSITVDEEIRVTHAVVRGEASALQQVVLNLCLNARDAMAGGVRPRLAVSLEALGDEGVQLVVRDTGRGMAPATLQRAGEPFFTTKEPGKGTGLGLATAIATITESGGTWSIDSEEGRGTTVTIRCPLVRAEPSAEVASAPAATPVAAHTVLVVDDEPLVRMALGRQLEFVGFRVVLCASAEDALRAVQEARIPTLRTILLDLSMPGMSGTQALPLFRAARPDVPVIVLSGHIADPAALGGAALVLQKPVPHAVLVDALQRVGDA